MITTCKAMGVENAASESAVDLRWIHHPVTGTMRDNGDCIRVRLYIPIIPPCQGGGST